MIDRLVLGGVEKTAIEQVRALREIGVDATLVVLKRDPSVPDAVREWLMDLPVEYLDDRLPRFLRTGWRIPGFYFFSLFHLLYAVVLPLRVRKGEWDVILSHNSYTTLTALAIWKIRGIPYCMFVWDPIASVLVRAYPTGLIRFLRPVLLPVGRWVDRSLVRGGRRVLVSSLSYVDYLRSSMRPEEELSMVPPGCRPAESARQKPGEYLLAATSWKAGKQLEVLLQALTLLPGPKLVVAGRWLHADYRSRIDELVSELGLTDRVSMTGEVSEKGMADLARNALCSVTLNAELGFGMPALEAAGQCCTFVCPRVAGVTAYFTDGIEAFYFDEGDSRGLASVLRPLVEQPDKAYRAGLAAWERARASLTWQHHARAIAAAIGAAPSAQATR
ncbi:MAG: glycosyltransferase family 4 protein [Candidatus Dormibacterales bacterium]